MENEQSKTEIVLSEELEKSIMKFFLRTSIPRKAKQERLKKVCPKRKDKRKNENSDLCSSFD